jgi:hypothetical protein
MQRSFLRNFSHYIWKRLLNNVLQNLIKFMGMPEKLKLHILRILILNLNENFLINNNVQII